MGNFIKIDRKILEWGWYKDEHTKSLFLHCLLKANWKDGRFKNVAIRRGQFVTSIPKLGVELELTSNEVRTAIKHLKSTGEITVRSYSKFSVFTVVNYDLYQVEPQTKSQANHSLLTGKSQSINRQITTIEEKKEIKEGNKYKQIIDLYNDICVSFSKVTKLSENRKKAIGARLKMYSIDDFKRLFELAEQSSFLKGANDRNWSVNFDWLIKDSNMAKVLDGNYNNPAPNSKYHRPKNAKQFEERDYNHDELEKQIREARDRKFEKLKKEKEK